MRFGQKVGAAIPVLVSIDVDEHPAHGAIGGDERVSPGGFVRHLWQVLDFDMDEAGLVVLRDELMCD